MRTVAMMQPAFLPWMGFFELILHADIFVFLDDFQFSVQSWHQRNRLFTNKGQVGWYTVPVRKTVSFLSPLNRAMINESIPWRNTLRKRLQQNYSKAPYYPVLAEHVEHWLKSPAESLADLNIRIIRDVCALFNISREFRLSSSADLHTDIRSSERVLAILRWCDADQYYCAQGSYAYMQQEQVFPVGDIEVLFQNFVPVPYTQVGSEGGFIPFLSVIDALMNVGPEKTLELIKTGTTCWLSWNDMARAAQKRKVSVQEAS